MFLSYFVLFSAKNASPIRVVQVNFEGSQIELSKDQEQFLDTLAPFLVKVVRLENYQNVQFELTSRISNSEFTKDKFLGVKRGVIVRDALLERLDNLECENFLIRDLVAKSKWDVGVQITIIN
tara:strand:+ start:293 stop:661 length:369 start_codon:yes stop_codon:yes gene_type:complete